MTESSSPGVRGPGGRWAPWRDDHAKRLRYLGVYHMVKAKRVPPLLVARAFGLKSRSQVYRIIEAVEASGILEG